MDRGSFRKIFPNLTKELENGDAKVNVDSVQTDTDSAKGGPPARFCNYTPTVIDFIRRCDTETQAESIIAFMEKRGELDEERAEEIRLQLRREGIRSLGSKKEDDYYFKQGGLC